MALNEFELIEKYFRRQFNDSGVNLGIGDDCALLTIDNGKSLAVTTDTLVEGVHFPTGAAPEWIAHRALRVNLSDVAAMGAEPRWFTLALTLPEANSAWLEDFSRGLIDTATEYSCVLVGGDTTRGPLTITLQMMGVVEPDKALTRAGARAGDLIYVTGSLGDGAAALAVVQGEVKVGEADSHYFVDHYYRPTPRLKEGRLLTGLASAAIDISDGLLADLGHICQASGVGATVDLEQISLSQPFVRLADGQVNWSWVLAGGDEYQLCFTVPPSDTAELNALAQSQGLQVKAIGVINDQQGITCLHQGQVIAAEKTGYQHFDGL